MPKVLPVPTGGASRGRSRRVATTLAEINVIPLVDVMLVLLIIFMVTAPMLQRGVELKLPQMSRAQEISSERLFVNVPLTFKDDQQVYLGKERVRLAFLGNRVRQMIQSRTDKKVYLNIDRGLLIQHQIDVFDELKGAGVEDVGFATDPREIR
jgi:biopolymer transport protein ExbD